MFESSANFNKQLSLIISMDQEEQGSKLFNLKGTKLQMYM